MFKKIGVHAPEISRREGLLFYTQRSFNKHTFVRIVRYKPNQFNLTSSYRKYTYFFPVLKLFVHTVST